VNGLKEEMAGKLDVVHLNLLSEAGREIGGRYGVKIVPATLLFNSRGELIRRVNGVPDKENLISQMKNGEPSG
jgi:hypothetical protein